MFERRPATMFTLSSLNGDDSISVPNPDNPSAKNIITTLVNSARNANAIVTAQKIGRDQEKTEMSWNFLTKEEWEELLMGLSLIIVPFLYPISKSSGINAIKSFNSFAFIFMYKKLV